MKDISPKEEPVAWATVVGLAIAAAASYGLNITDELSELLVLVVPMLIAGWVARRNVTPVANPKLDVHDPDTWGDASPRRG